MFYVSLLEQDTIRKRQINKFVSEFEIGDNKEYEVEVIQDGAIYTKETNGHLLKL